MRLIIYGAPRTKKNHGSVMVKAGRKVHIPSAPWMAWRDVAVMQIPKSATLTDQAYNCRAIFYREANTGDAVGYYQGLADVLEEAGVVSNDRLIVAWDGSRLRKDARNPRVELELTPLTDNNP